MPKVSVIIPTYNEQETINDCLKSISDQSFKDMEIIVVDDGSTDGTLEVVSRYCLDKNHCKVWRQKHKGAGAARNYGATKASGEILVFVDADMIFDHKFVEKLIKPIIKDKQLGTFSKEEFLVNKNNAWARFWNINRGLPADRMQPANYPDTQKVFRAVKKDAFEGVGGFNEKAGYADDWTLSAKLGILAVAAPGAKFYHKNPDDMREVFMQSKWMAKRKYKLGVIGYFAALARASFPVSLVIGTYLAIKHANPAFLFFKIISDFGQFLGVLEFWLMGSTKK